MDAKYINSRDIPRLPEKNIQRNVRSFFLSLASPKIGTNWNGSPFLLLLCGLGRQKKRRKPPFCGFPPLSWIRSRIPYFFCGKWWCCGDKRNWEILPGLFSPSTTALSRRGIWEKRDWWKNSLFSAAERKKLYKEINFLVRRHGSREILREIHVLFRCLIFYWRGKLEQKLALWCHHHHLNHPKSASPHKKFPSTCSRILFFWGWQYGKYCDPWV